MGLHSLQKQCRSCVFHWIKSFISRQVSRHFDEVTSFGLIATHVLAGILVNKLAPPIQNLFFNTASFTYESPHSWHIDLRRTTSHWRWLRSITRRTVISFLGRRTQEVIFVELTATLNAIGRVLIIDCQVIACWALLWLTRRLRYVWTKFLLDFMWIEELQSFQCFCILWQVLSTFPPGRTYWFIFHSIAAAEGETVGCKAWRSEGIWHWIFIIFIFVDHYVYLSSFSILIIDEVRRKLVP